MGTYRNPLALAASQKARFAQAINALEESAQDVGEDLKARAEELTAGAVHDADTPYKLKLPIGIVTGKLHDSWRTEVRHGHGKASVELHNDAPEAKYTVKNPKRGFGEALKTSYASIKLSVIHKTLAKVRRIFKRG